MEVFWKQLYDCPFYQISNTGLVKSLDRVLTDKLGRPMTKRGVLKTLRTNGIDPHVYFETCFTQDGTGIRVRKTLHISVAVAHHFLPQPNRRHIYVKHKDGNHANNHADNLIWATHKQVCRKQYFKKNKSL